MGFAYVQSLKSWVALASDAFEWELESALGWPQELHMTNLKPAQQLRSARLLAILTQAFAEYPRAHMIGLFRRNWYGWFFSGSARNVWF